MTETWARCRELLKPAVSCQKWGPCVGRLESPDTVVYLSLSSTSHILLPGDRTAHLAVHKAGWKTSSLKGFIFYEMCCLNCRKTAPVSLIFLLTKFDTIRELHAPPPTLLTSVASVRLTKTSEENHMENELKKILSCAKEKQRRRLRIMKEWLWVIIPVSKEVKDSLWEEK